jgi:hypothetical protein
LKRDEAIMFFRDPYTDKWYQTGGYEMKPTTLTRKEESRRKKEQRQMENLANVRKKLRDWSALSQKPEKEILESLEELGHLVYPESAKAFVKGRVLECSKYISNLQAKIWWNY